MISKHAIFSRSSSPLGTSHHLFIYLMQTNWNLEPSGSYSNYDRRALEDDEELLQRDFDAEELWDREYDSDELLEREYDDFLFERDVFDDLD